jgi:hypothetical protein
VLDLLPKGHVFDGELVVLGDAGRPLFNELLFGRRRPTCVAFDLPIADGIDLRRPRKAAATGAANATFRSLHDVWACTTTPHGRRGLVDSPSRTAPVPCAHREGRSLLFGRPPKLTPHQRREAIARRDAGETLTDIARCNVSHSTISRLR